MEKTKEIVSDSEKIYRDNHDEFLHSYNDREKVAYRTARLHMELERKKYIDVLIEKFSDEKEKNIIRQKLEEIENTHMKPENILANYNFKVDREDAKSNCKLEYFKLCCYINMIIDNLCNNMLEKGKRKRIEMLNNLDIIHELSILQIEEEAPVSEEISKEAIEETIARLNLKEFDEDELEEDDED